MSDVDSIRWENDEEGVWRLTLDGDGFPLGPVSFRLREHGAARELWEKIDSTLGVHIRAGRMAALEFQRECELAEEMEDAYALDDPKHPTYRERMVG